ncbi:preprotein translocase subunit SecE [Pseudactinotalea sp.]|uniref:preprotein translocase subunit SecE n=1 Tax=Pseudactinotalea sp. TaxID=1926260 RepID=UPI003B3BA3D4
MSRSTNASQGTPDDDEGRLDDAQDDGAEATHDVTDDVTDEPSDAVEHTDDEPDADEADSADKELVPAGKSERPAAKKRSGGQAARSASPTRRPTGARGPQAKKEERRGPIAAIVLFVRQVISELRKVVTPTSKELVTYSAVVIVFVLIVMAYVGVLDFAVGKLILWAFGG